VKPLVAVLVVAVAGYAGAFAPHGLAAKAPAHKAAAGYAGRADVQAFIDELVQEYGFSRASLTRTFAAARYQPKIVAAMQRPLL